MPFREKRVETLVGLFLFVGLALLGALIIQYGRIGERVRDGYLVTVEFTDASGVIKGSEVRLGGAKIGQVIEKPALGANRKVKVKIELKKDVSLPENAVFQIASLSLLGDKAISVSIPQEPSERVLQPGAEVSGGGSTGLEALQSDAESIAENARVLMENAKTSLLKFDAALDDIRAVAGRLTEGIETLNVDVLSPENLEKLSGTLENLEAASGSIKEASVDLKPILADARDGIKSVTSAAEAAEGTFARATSELDHIEPALRDIPGAVASIKDAADAAADTLSGVKEGEGLVGTLLSDEEVGTDAKTFMKNLRRYGILGYRDADTFDERDPRNRFRGKRR
ncbi:MAG: MCE family protein [Akkermansiaceae bacterium]|nr:MCE family protein [Akkermansiaceae bacterium]NNM30076.1 MCE family protein [Akkermansiaceae bacterium]